MKINTCETPHGAKIVDAFCLCLFPRVWLANTQSPNWSSMADDAITRSGIGVLGSTFYICGTSRSVCGLDIGVMTTLNLLL